MAIFNKNQILERNPGLTDGEFKNWLFNRKTNGMEASGAVFKVGRRNYVDEDKFNAWLKGLAEQQAA